MPSFPFYYWLPEVHSESNSSISLLLAGLILKLSIYALIRFIFINSIILLVSVACLIGIIIDRHMLLKFFPFYETFFFTLAVIMLIYSIDYKCNDSSILSAIKFYIWGNLWIEYNINTKFISFIIIA